MIFFLQDDVSNKVDGIIKQLNKLMDGDVSSQMKDHGLKYRLNYGASILWLRNLAKQYGKDNELATRLWHREIRETMILATMIADEGSISIETIKNWSSILKYNEVAEQLGANLLWSIDGLEQLATDWLKEDDDYNKAAVWVALSVYLQRGNSIDETSLKTYFEYLEKSFHSTSKFMLRVQGRFLRQICRKSSEMLSLVDCFIDRIKTNANCAWLVEDVKTEISFLRDRNE